MAALATGSIQATRKPLCFRCRFDLFDKLSTIHKNIVGHNCPAVKKNKQYRLTKTS
jgi:hypothetical protein